MGIFIKGQFLLTILLNLISVCVCEEHVNSAIFTPYVIECPVVPLPTGNSSCQCDPPNITVTDTDSLAAFQYVSCKLTPELISATNPDPFYFPRSRRVYIDCSWNNSLSYSGFLMSAVKECGDIAEEVDPFGDVDCFTPFNITADTYMGLPSLQKLTLALEDGISIKPDAFSPLKNLEVLSLVQLDLKSLHPEVFRGLTHLRQLSLWDNDIRELPDGIFNDLQDLQVLSLRSNSITHISRDLLKPLEFLNTLYLDDNNISSIHADAFRSMRSLEEVDLSRNNLDEKFSLSFLGTEKLLLSYNSLTSFTEDTVPGVRGYTTSLDLSHNLISSISESVFQTDELLSSLSYVVLRNNRLESLPTNVLRWARRLTFIDFSYNSLETLHDGLFDIQSNPLGEQRLAGNQLVVRLGGNPFTCDCRLTWFRIYDGQDVWISDRDDIECFSPPNLNGIPLFSIRPEHFECPLSDSLCPEHCQCYEVMKDLGLQTPRRVINVECESENLTRIPRGIPSNTSSLDLTGNIWNTLRKSMLDTRMPFLSDLTLTRCSIVRIESGAFRLLNSVLQLKLDGNNFRNITKGTFQGLTRLNTLYLNHSSIRTIADGVFLDTPSLTYLYLHGNFLTVLPAIQHFPQSLEIVSLQENPLTCSCNLISLQGLVKYTLEVKGNVTCRERDGTTVSLANLDSSYCRKHGTSPLLAPLASLGAITGVLVVVLICVFLYKKNKTLFQLMLLRYFPQDLSEDDANKPFDVFISYCQLDDEFVLRYLVPLLETEDEPSYTICLHHRHFVPGDTIANNIVSAVAQSRRVILVLSDNFLQSDWCMYEFRMAHLQALHDRRNTLLIITLGDISQDSLDPDLKAYIRTTTYLESFDSKFKNKLFLALKRGRSNQRTARNQIKLVDFDGI
eukprot:XP_011665655.1 PREDICTED: slit homolog 2 protein-like [Strongylocentrotus purpuratus]